MSAHWHTFVADGLTMRCACGCVRPESRTPLVLAAFAALLSFVALVGLTAGVVRWVMR